MKQKVFVLNPQDASSVRDLQKILDEGYVVETFLRSLGDKVIKEYFQNKK